MNIVYAHLGILTTWYGRVLVTRLLRAIMRIRLAQQSAVTFMEEAWS